MRNSYTAIFLEGDPSQTVGGNVFASKFVPNTSQHKFTPIFTLWSLKASLKGLQQSTLSDSLTEASKVSTKPKTSLLKPGGPVPFLFFFFLGGGLGRNYFDKSNEKHEKHEKHRKRVDVVRWNSFVPASLTVRTN